MKVSTSSESNWPVARGVAHLGDRLLGGHRSAVATTGGHRVVGGADREDARGEGDLVADQPGRVAAAVDSLVVVEDRVGDLSIAVERSDENGAFLWVVADDREILLGDDLGAQDAIGPCELADLVQQAGRVDDVALLL